MGSTGAKIPAAEPSSGPPAPLLRPRLPPPRSLRSTRNGHVHHQHCRAAAEAREQYRDADPKGRRIPHQRDRDYQHDYRREEPGQRGSAEVQNVSDTRAATPERSPQRQPADACDEAD